MSKHWYNNYSCQCLLTDTWIILNFIRCSCVCLAVTRDRGIFHMYILAATPLYRLLWSMSNTQYTASQTLMGSSSNLKKKVLISFIVPWLLKNVLALSICFEKPCDLVWLIKKYLAFNYLLINIHNVYSEWM